jgi:hypothetical protein
MKPGTKLYSATCNTEVMVIRCSENTAIECGGAPMSTSAVNTKTEPSGEHQNGTMVGKRYIDQAGTVELLCTKPGTGSLAMDGVAMGIKDAKPLPSSD